MRVGGVRKCGGGCDMFSQPIRIPLEGRLVVKKFTGACSITLKPALFSKAIMLRPKSWVSRFSKKAETITFPVAWALTVCKN